MANSRFVFLLAFFALPLVSRGETIRSASPPFELDLPAEWGTHPSRPEGAEWAWIRDLPGGARLAIVIEVLPDMILAENLSTLSTAELRKRVGEQSSDVAVLARQTMWQGKPVNVVEIEGSANGARVLNCTCLIPLREKALRLNVIGAKSAEAEIRSELARTLGALHGEPAWKRGWMGSPAFWGILAVCCSGYIGAIVYGLVYLIVFRWDPDSALKVRYWWQVTNVVLILGMVAVSQAISFFTDVFGEGKSKNEYSNKDSALLCPAVFCIPVLMSIQRLKERLKQQAPAPSPSMPVFPAPGGPPPADPPAAGL